MLTATDASPRRASDARALPYVPALDGVRALAVAGVVLYHAGVTWMPGGFLGVDVFFVLSGFLITSLLLAERGGGGRIDLRRFWTRRARRLLPAAFLVIAVSVLAVAIVAPGDLARTRADALASFVYVNNWHELVADQSYFVAFERPSLLQHLWSLAVEEQFYLLWPLALGALLPWVGKRRTALVTLAAALASAVLMAVLFVPGRDPSRVYYGTDTHASGLLIGCALAFAWPLGRMRAPRRRSAVAILDAGAIVALAGIAGAMLSWKDWDSFVYRGGLSLVACCTAVLLAAVTHPACRVGRVLGTPALRWVGQRSYGIYLWHWPLMTLTRPGLDLTWWRPAIVLGQVAATLALAAASYRWVEQPIRTGAARAWLDRRAPRRRLAVAVAVLAAVVASAAWVAGRGTPVHAAALRLAPNTVAARRAPAERPAKHAAARPLAVGASVMLAAQPYLGRHVVVDAAVGRQPADILARLERYRAAGRLPDRVVVQMGENGPISDADLRRLHEILRGVRRVVLVNVRVPRRWSDDVNRALARAAARWPQARVADWYDASARAGLLYEDGTHPMPPGQRVYARLVERKLRR